MTILKVEDPQSLRDIAQSVLAENADYQPLIAGAPAGGADADSVLGALPVYHLTLEDLAEANLEQANQSAWRYVSVSETGEFGATVDIDLTVQDGEERPVSLSEGRRALRLAQQAALIQEVFEPSENEFSPRLLSVPELSFEGVWLNSEDDNRLFPLHTVEGFPDDDISGFEWLRERAATRIEMEETEFNEDGPPPGGS